MMFITFEGIDGAGKSTQIALLKEFIEKQLKLEVVVTREPGGTELGKRLRAEILHGDNIADITELLLYAADRAEHVEKLIRPALKRGAVVISDRFSDSTIAYQAGGRSLSKSLIEELNILATKGLRPDLTFLLDLSVEESEKRINSMQREKDRLESQKSDFFLKVRKAFLEIAEEDPWRVKVLDATEELHSISADVFAQVALKFEEIKNASNARKSESN